MRAILDASIGFKTLVTEDLSDKANQLMDEFRQGIHELLTPDIYPIEIGHALTRAERQGRIATSDGFSLWTGMMADCPQLLPSLPLMPRAYVLSSLLRIGIYDMVYCALAEQEDCPLITADVRLINKLQGIVRIVPLSTL